MKNKMNFFQNNSFKKIYQQTMLVIISVFVILIILSLTEVIQPPGVASGGISERQPVTSRPESISHSINGTKITASQLRRSGDMILVNVCYPLPDARDWQLREVTLEYGNRIIREYGTAWIEETGYPPVGTTPGQRCVKLRFMAEQFPGYSGWHRVVVGVLYAEPYEGEYCTTYLKEVQQALNKLGSGIEVKCSEPPVGGIEVASVPEGMNMEEANKFIQSEEFRYSLRSIKGPWVFEFFLDE